MQITEIPPWLFLILPIPLTPLVGWLEHDRLPSWFNSAISVIVIAGIAFVWTLYTKALTPNLIEDFVIIFTYSEILIGKTPLAQLEHWLIIKLPSPFSAFAPPLPARSGLHASVHDDTRETEAVDPQGTQYRLNRDDLPPRG